MKSVNCNFCGSGRAKILYKARDRMVRKDAKQEFYIHRCENCGLAYLNPQPEWADLEYFYGGNYYTNISSNAPKRNIFYRVLRRMKRVVFGLPNPKFWHFGMSKGRFLDIGCGNAVYESYVTKNYPGWEFYGVEPNHNSACLAEQVPDLTVFEGFLEEAHYKNDFFDVVLMNHSLEHLFDPLSTLKECYRILKPGGRLVIDVPNFDSPARRLFGSYWVHLDAPRHLFHFSPGVLRAMLEACGFQVESLNFEVLSGSIIRSVAYWSNVEKFFFEKPLILTGIHYLILPINKAIEMLGVASGLRVTALKD